MTTQVIKVRIDRLRFYLFDKLARGLKVAQYSIQIGKLKQNASTTTTGIDMFHDRHVLGRGECRGLMRTVMQVGSSSVKNKLLASARVLLAIDLRSILSNTLFDTSGSARAHCCVHLISPLLTPFLLSKCPFHSSLP